jgi:hypothetical protein
MSDVSPRVTTPAKPAGKEPTFLEIKIENGNVALLTDRHGKLWHIDFETGKGKPINFEAGSET